MIRKQVLLSTIFTTLALVATLAQAQSTTGFGIAYNTVLEATAENDSKPRFAFTAAPAFAIPNQNGFQLFNRFEPSPNPISSETTPWFTTRLTLDNPFAVQRLGYDALAINRFGNTQLYLGLGLELNSFASFGQNAVPGMRALVGWNGFERELGMFVELQAFSMPFGPWNGSSSGFARAGRLESSLNSVLPCYHDVTKLHAS